ncbi:phage baseplate assembly protein [Martelella radicis]|uniref:Prophage tail gpP-like protein n=1 Tax=Martelella radicis TaxID=1397476 RepID=A0A7W6KKW1_9HYPH|nr:Mu P family protein [Martelella radicis]MBB4122910.1 prophage tail gpP-like protein [Martelella radicis]
MIEVTIDGARFDGWTGAEVALDMKEFAAHFSLYCHDHAASAATLAHVHGAKNKRLKRGTKVSIKVDGTVVLNGHIEKRSSNIESQFADITVEGRCKLGDLVDCTALIDDTPAEMHNVKLEDAVSRIIKPYGLGVRNEIDTGAPFARYSIDLDESPFVAIEKGARQRQARVLSDGVGNVVITRTGEQKAAGRISLPGNVLKASIDESDEGRYSKTVVRGTSERAGKARGQAKLDVTAEPLPPADRAAGDGAATSAERAGTAATGVAEDEEIGRYRPKVYLARTKADHDAARAEAEWRRNTARGAAEEITYVMKGHSVDGALWRPNTIVPVSDAFNDIARDMLISKVTFIQNNDDGAITSLAVTSPDAFQEGDPKRKQRKNKVAKPKKALDTTAEPL